MKLLKLLLPILLLTLFSCNRDNGVVDFEKIKDLKVGMSELEVYGLMEENPWETQYDSNKKRMYYTYEKSSWSANRTSISITFVNGKVQEFYSY